MAQPDHLTFHYQKSTHYRVIHADGAWGGLTPKLGVFLAFFSERPPIPQTITHSVESGRSLGPEVSHETKEGLIREVEVGIIMDEQTTSSLIAWLQQRLDNIREIREKSDTPHSSVINPIN